MPVSVEVKYEYFFTWGGRIKIVEMVRNINIFYKLKGILVDLRLVSWWILWICDIITMILLLHTLWLHILKTRCIYYKSTIFFHLFDMVSVAINSILHDLWYKIRGQTYAQITKFWQKHRKMNNINIICHRSKIIKKYDNIIVITLIWI